MTSHEATDTHVKEVSAEIAGEHHRVLALVKRVREAQELDALVPLLDELHDLLMNHFAHEQYPGGFYDAIGAKGPDHAETVSDLIEDHNEMLSRLRNLVERARARGPSATEGMREEALAVVDRLQVHEEKEHKLAQEVLGSSSP